MIATHKSLGSWTAEELMSRDVKTVLQSTLLQDAARLLAREQISGAPVVDEAGRCVGMLSAADFVRWAERGSAAVEAQCNVCYCSDWQVVDVELLPPDEVCCYMTSDPVLAAPSDSIAKLARKMLDAHIHRVVVVDAAGRPIGIVSTTDILAAVADATAEPF